MSYFGTARYDRVMEDLILCPYCQVDLRKNGAGPASRAIEVVIRGVYDRVLFLECPDCGGRWHRLPEGHALRAKAEQYITGPKSTT